MRYFLTIICAVWLMFCHQKADAQQKQFYGGLKYGPVLPMGEMASHQFGTGGYALLGKSVGLQAGYYLNKNLGVGVDISFKYFPFASGYYLEDYIQSEPFFTHVDMLSTEYKVKTYIATVFYKTKKYKKFSSELKLGAGLFNARTPDQFYVVQAYDAGTLYFWKTSALSRKAGLFAGASLHYDIYEFATITLDGSFTFARPAFTFTRDTGGYTDYMYMPMFTLEPGIMVKF